jgi:regulator of sigma E protease
MTILIFLIILGIIVLVHECGHFFVAKKFGIRVDEFGIGFPPKVYGKKIGETEYTINWFPIGGFVRIWGEDPTEEHLTGPGSERSFVSKPRYQQALVLVAGVTMNVILAFVLYTLSYMIGMPTAVDNAQDASVSNVHLTVTNVLPKGPADAFLKPGDQIESVSRASGASLDTAGIASTTQVANFIAESKDAAVTLGLVRGTQHFTHTASPKAGVISSDPSRYALGFSMSFVGTSQYGLWESITRGAERTYGATSDILGGFGELLHRIGAGTADMSQVAGPVGIVNMVGDAASLGLVWLLTFSAFISLNLAVINVLPIPALDGGRLLFVLIEAIIRRPISPSIANRVNTIGFIALLALMALVTVHDVIKLFN